MNIHLLTYLTNRIFWFYTVYRYNSALYVKEKNPHRWLCYVFSYVIGCCANMCLGTIKGNVIFNLLGLVLIACSRLPNINVTNSPTSSHLCHLFTAMKAPPCS